MANTRYIAKWNGVAWSALSTELNSWVQTLAFDAKKILYVGGLFTNAAYPYLCKWDGTSFSAVGTNADINNFVYFITEAPDGKIYVGGLFTNAGGVANADYIACWNGSQWEALGTGVNNAVYTIRIYNEKVYVGGYFDKAGGITLTDRFAIWSNGAWQPVDINFPGNAVINDILLASDGSLYIGGGFSTTSSSENAKTGIVALNLNVSSASANTYPFISIMGPGTLKAITNYTTGKSVMLMGSRFKRVNG